MQQIGGNSLLQQNDNLELVSKFLTIEQIKENF